MDKLFGPGGERIAGPIQQQAAAVRQELAMGRLAMRVLGVLLSEMPKRRTRIRPARYERMMTTYPGAALRFGEDAQGLTVRLLMPEEAAAETAEQAKGNGASRPAE